MRMFFLISMVLFCGSMFATDDTSLTPANVNIPSETFKRIGMRIWQNECGGSVTGLTSWKTGEEFASLGIGHFIWYPEKGKKPFLEQFPKLVKYFLDNRVDVPAWIASAPFCPWRTREEFMQNFESRKMKELRDLLASTVDLQTRFLVRRLQDAFPKVLDAAPKGEREKVQHNFELLLKSPDGTFALIDYVNFKGEGIYPKESYDGKGWGLLQVLLGMGGNVEKPIDDFIASAEFVLERRVENAPMERQESRWLPGWKKRVQRYREPL